MKGVFLEHIIKPGLWHIYIAFYSIARVKANFLNIGQLVTVWQPVDSDEAIGSWRQFNLVVFIQD